MLKCMQLGKAKIKYKSLHLSQILKYWVCESSEWVNLWFTSMPTWVVPWHWAFHPNVWSNTNRKPIGFVKEVTLEGIQGLEYFWRGAGVIPMSVLCQSSVPQENWAWNLSLNPLFFFFSLQCLVRTMMLKALVSALPSEISFLSCDSCSATVQGKELWCQMLQVWKKNRLKVWSQCPPHDQTASLLVLKI